MSNNLKRLILLRRQNKKIINVQPKNNIYNVIINRIHPSQLNHKQVKPIPTFPQKVDLRNKFPPPFDQGSIGSCTANALCGLVAYDDPQLIGSRLFLYYNERKLENDIPDDAGALISDGIKCLLNYGICPESDWVYDITKFAVKPLDKCYTNALNHKALEVYHIKNTLIDMKTALSHGIPFVVGISIYSSFETQSVANTGVVPMPTHSDTLLGGHAVVCVGYDDSKKVWIMRNSWGIYWGDKGYFYLPYSYLLDSNLATDLWTINKI